MQSALPQQRDSRVALHKRFTLNQHHSQWWPESECALLCMGGTEGVGSSHGQGVVRPGHHLCPHSWAARIAGGNTQTQAEACDVEDLAWARSTSHSACFSVWIGFFKEKNFQLTNWSMAAEPSLVIKYLWKCGVESWSNEPEKDAEYLSGSRSQFHKQGFQQCH